MATLNPLKNITASSHPIKDILDSRNIFITLLKKIFLIALATIAIVNIYFIIKYLVTPAAVYKKDFIQEYLFAQALLNGVDPYLPISQLAQQFIDRPIYLWSHPSPHPPIVAVLCLPFCIFTYEYAIVAWFIFEIICIFFAIYLFFYKLQKKSGFKLIIVTFFFLLAWPPLYYELIYGQLTALLFVLLTCAWLTLGSKKNITGGIFIGLLIAIKLMAWPFIIFLTIRKNWPAVIAASITVITSNMIAGLIMGFDQVLYYYFKVSAIVSPLYRGCDSNFSMWTIGWRLFEGTGSPIIGLTSLPIVDSPFLALFSSCAMSILFLSVGLRLALRARSFDTSFGILVCVSTLVNPVAWGYYLILTLIPVVIVGRDLSIHGMPKTETWCFLLLCASLSIPSTTITDFILKLTGHETTMVNAQVPFAAALLTLIPAISVILLLWLVSHMDRFYKDGTNINDGSLFLNGCETV